MKQEGRAVAHHLRLDALEGAVSADDNTRSTLITSKRRGVGRSQFWIDLKQHLHWNEWQSGSERSMGAAEVDTQRQCRSSRVMMSCSPEFQACRQTQMETKDRSRLPTSLAMPSCPRHAELCTESSVSQAQIVLMFVSMSRSMA